MSPERLLGKEYERSVDVWSAGLILYELIKGDGKLAFQGNTREELLNDILVNSTIDLPKHVSNATINLIKSIFAFDDTKRPSFE